MKLTKEQEKVIFEEMSKMSRKCEVHTWKTRISENGVFVYCTSCSDSLDITEETI